MARILFVDDDPFTLETLSKAVQMFGHRPMHASTGKEALTLIAQENPDLIFVDMRLTDMDGLTLVKSLQAGPATQDIPVLMLSAGPEIDLPKRAKEAGARDYLPKPIRLQTLIDTIKKYTEN